MKKLILTLFSVCLLLLAMPLTGAFAAETPAKEPSSGVPDESARRGGSVTITVVLPDKAETPIPEAEPEITQEPEAAPAPEPTAMPKIVLYPVDVSETKLNGGWQIVKTYELTALDNPADIPNGDFERKCATGANWRFTLTDIIKRETANADTKPHTETVTLNTDTKELEKILTLLAPTMEYKTDDEFVGILNLDVASIKVETAGTKTSSYTMSVTRESPRLSAADTSLIPKTVEEKGKTYTLAGVDWKAGNYETVDYEQVPEYYTAIATYTATGTSTKVTGYITTAEYNGTLAKLSQGKTVYTAYFEGEEIRTPLEFTQPTSDKPMPGTEGKAPAEQPTAEPTETPAPAETPDPTTAAEPATESGGSNTTLYVIIAVLLMMLGGAAYIIIRRNPRNEKTDNPAADAHADDGDGDTGSGR
jgi:hypothetical protein